MEDGNFKEETIIVDLQGNELVSEKVPAIQLLSGQGLGKLHVLEDGEFTIGRHQKANITFNDEAISRFHCKLIVRDKRVLLKDLDSANGTFVNGERSQEIELRAGDKFKISPEIIFKFDYVDQVDQASQEALYDMAISDSLTGAHTKRYFLDQLQTEFSFALRRNNPLSLIIFDIDFFKKVNDEYGHLAGDEVLKKIAQTTEIVIRNEDVFGRYGGEEFVILMRDTKKQDALRLAERLRLIIENTVVETREKEISVTISLGLASLENSNFSEKEELIKAADDMLYQAKKSGRNRICS